MQRTTATETLSSSWAKKLEIKAKRQAIMAMEKEMRDNKLREIEVRKFQVAYGRLTPTQCFCCMGVIGIPRSLSRCPLSPLRAGRLVLRS